MGGDIMIYIGKISKIVHFHNTNRLSINEVKKLMGCDIVINSVFFESNFKPCNIDLKIDGSIIMDDPYKSYGFAWSKDKADLKMMVSTDAFNQYDNFATCIPLIKDGATLPFECEDIQKTCVAGQTAIATLSDGKTLVFCSLNNNGPLTRPQLQQYLSSNKFGGATVVDAISFDGGVSCGAITPEWTLNPLNEHGANVPRVIPYYFCMWVEKENIKMDTSTKIRGIDVSQFQKDINWENVMNSGIKFAILRAGFGKNNIDPYFIKNIEACNRFGIPVGVYWFSYALNADMAKKEAQYCLEAIKNYKVELPVCFDFEYDSVNYANKNGINMTRDLATSILTAFCNEIEAAGYFAMVYTGIDFSNNHFDASVLQRYALWLANYPNNVNLDNPPRTCGIWQYSSKGAVNGITGNVDMNVMYNDYQSIIRDNGLNHISVPVPTSTPTPTPVPEEPWYTKAQKWAKDQNISDGTRPDDNATRAEIWSMLYKMNGGK